MYPPDCRVLTPAGAYMPPALFYPVVCPFTHGFPDIILLEPFPGPILKPWGPTKWIETGFIIRQGLLPPGKGANKGSQKTGPDLSKAVCPGMIPVKSRGIWGLEIF